MNALTAMLLMAANIVSPADATMTPVLPEAEPSAAPAPLQGVGRVTASSTLTEKGRPASFYAPERAVDGKLSTCWCKGTRGDGKGEWLQIDFAKPTRIKGLRVYPGCGSSQTIYGNNNRISKLTVETGSRSSFTLPDERRLHDLEVRTPSPVTSVRFTIEAVYPGKKFDDTCIGEVLIDAE